MTNESSALENASLGKGVGGAARYQLAREPLTWIDRATDWFSEFFSSILVKETRQSVKSRQFTISYIILLVAVGGWALLGLSIRGNDLGQQLLNGFFVILGFPLGIIIPFSAYRSLAREFEDGTIQLISITTMKPYQIVLGKLASAMLQMVVYLSVIAPCILFTLMLRGIVIESITLMMIICVGGCISLTILGLFLAGAFRTRTLGVGVSVLFVLALGITYFCWCALISEWIYYGAGIRYRDNEFYMVVFGLASFFGSLTVLILVAAICQISFPSDNRSTPIRIAMLFQQSLFFGFIVALFSSGEMGGSPDDVIFGSMFAVSHYWLLMGFLLSGESTGVSRRVQRSIPKSFFGRSLVGLVMPGAGRGLLFALANLIAGASVVVLIGVFCRSLVIGDTTRQLKDLDLDVVVGIGTQILYVAGFLSLNYLICQRFMKIGNSRDWNPSTGPLISLVIGISLVFSSTFLSFLIHATLWSTDYSLVLLLNWYATSVDMAFTGEVSAYFGIPFLAVVFLIAGVVFWAIRHAVQELLLRPLEIPTRIKIEDDLNKPSAVPKGESIDEIFGEVKPRPQVEE